MAALSYSGRRKGGDFTLQFKNVANGDTFTLPAWTLISDVVVERIASATDMTPTAGGDAGDSLAITGVTSALADFTSVAVKRSTMTAGAGISGAADTTLTFAKVDADADTLFNCYVVCKKYKMSNLVL